MIYLNSKYLSLKLGINSAKWKRWSREFLDPDPLGGYQSGFARQFSIKDAFRVHLGGYLVADLKFTIPEARRILSDLHCWLKENNFYSLAVQSSRSQNESHHIYIYQLADGGFGYAIRRITGGLRRVNGGQWHEPFELQLIGSLQDATLMDQLTSGRLIYINTLYEKFLLRIGH